ncbi:Thioesterase/thiol ester dehydrase-isomerase [Karstenula rhodostoma CBS 690.94]|uniref:Thioesterase/thiol ester dehydrase-isomerase n=1 Tax=Karstenula rhodostoma CBS 690.94 TaxID=1392251 RepID=A0A9P4PJQ9_9PLEO|nr:Thioesterase/thiol ester dehydrase-isomerase [Karstenula rhodostoma CBS 690.94]
MRLLARSVLPTRSPPTHRAPHAPRQHSTSAPSKDAATAALSPRWLSDLKTRVGQCIAFGISREQVKEAGDILHNVNFNWKDLVAGSEGFLTGKHRWGLHRQQVAWGEMDSMGHVNNVTYNRWAESARVNWGMNFARMDTDHRDEWEALVTPKGIGMILRSIRTDYKFPIKYPDRVTVLHRLRSMPKADTDHFILDVVILSELHRRVAARCVEDIVMYNYKAGKKSAMEPFMIDMLQETFNLQEQAKLKYGNKALELIRRVQALEKASWDRPDAKEDFGSANP